MSRFFGIAGFLIPSGTLFGQSKEELRRKYGEPISETFMVRPGISVIATYATAAPSPASRLSLSECPGKHQYGLIRRDTPDVSDTETGTTDRRHAVAFPAGSEAQRPTRQAHRAGDESQSCRDDRLGSAAGRCAEGRRNPGRRLRWREDCAEARCSGAGRQDYWVGLLGSERRSLTRHECPGDRDRASPDPAGFCGDIAILGWHVRHCYSRGNALLLARPAGERSRD